MPRHAAPIVLAAAAVAGCGGSADKPVQLPAGPSSGPTYKGRTTQGQTIALTVEGGRVRANLRFELGCQDGSQTEATLTTEAKRNVVQSDGSFYYAETGRANFRGFGDGVYRTAVAGQIQGESGSGTASFRISFKGTNCRANARWRATRA
jgi:hypothetical protein